MSDSEKPKSWRERRQLIKHKWAVPFIFPEWLCEWLSYLLGQWALLDICGHIGRFGVLVSITVGMVVYVMEADERRMKAENERQQAIDQRKAKHYQAWQVINSAYGKPAGGGRKDALEDLHKDKVPLVGIDISQAYLPELNLAGAELTGGNFARAKLRDANLAQADLTDANLTEALLMYANFTGAYLTDANLARANLMYAHLTEAYLGDANLAEAYLVDANLAEADLTDANLARTDLHRANFTGAYLTDANLARANLMYANLTEAYLVDANLTKAGLGFVNLARANLMYANLAESDLADANLMDIKNWQNIESIRYANIYGVKNPPDGFIEWAKEQGAVEIENYEKWLEYKEKQK